MSKIIKYIWIYYQIYSKCTKIYLNYFSDLHWYHLSLSWTTTVASLKFSLLLLLFSYSLFFNIASWMSLKKKTSNNVITLIKLSKGTPTPLWQNLCHGLWSPHDLSTTSVIFSPCRYFLCGLCFSHTIAYCLFLKLSNLVSASGALHWILEYTVLRILFSKIAYGYLTFFRPLLKY